MATQTKIPHPTVSNPWWGHDPSDKQWLKALYAYEDCPGLCSTAARRVLARRAICSWLLSSTSTYPHYRALILRKTYADLSLPGAIMDRAIDPGGTEWKALGLAILIRRAISLRALALQFGYLASVRDHFRYQGAEVHFIGIDEASQIPSHQLEVSSLSDSEIQS